MTLLLVVVGGCRSAQAGTVAEGQAQPFFCERSHTNHAWGYRHRGIYVDGAGGVFRYVHGTADHRLLRVPADSLTEQALLARYAPGRRPMGTVPARQMAERYRQVVAASVGELSERVRRGADMGTTVRRCYLPDASTGVYREVLLRQGGDWSRENRAPAAAQLSAWLDSLALRAIR